MTGNVLVSQADSRLRISREGVAEIVASVKTDIDENLLSKIPAPGDAHPTFSNLKAREYDIVTKEGGIAVVEILYDGYISPLPPAVWEVSGSTAQEPIRTSPNWEGIAAIADSENGLVLDENGAFVEFTAPDELAGVQAYLAPGTLLTQRYVTTTFPTSDQNALGKIDTPPSTGANGWDQIPSMTSGDENWLKIDFNARDLGNKDAYLITNQWLKSGPNGWSSVIYSTFSSS